MRTEQEIKAILEETTHCKAQCLTKKPIGNNVHYEWALISKESKTVEALIATTEDDLYQVLFVKAWLLSGLAIVDKKLHE